MQKIVECVPNFSEGRDKGVINAITAEISGTDGAELLDVDPGADTNRTVVTMAGAPEGVLEAAFKAIKKAAELIDMSRHAGAHPRFGATDVCPFVPVSGMTMDECVELAKRLGERVGRELGIPVYLYEHAATRPDRQSLADIRQGEYEALPEKHKDPGFKPDYGPAAFNKKSGVTAIGARQFLVAYNVNLNTRDKKLAHEIALNIREGGRSLRGEDGKFVRDENGEVVRQPGTLKAARAVGWYIDEYGQAQVSINLINTSITQPHVAFDEVVRQAEALGLRVTGSEIVGLIPLESMIAAGRHYIRKQGLWEGVPEREIVHIAIKSMGLADLSPFDPDEKIIEYKLRKKTPSLIKMTVRDFLDTVSSDAPAPGGGSVAALSGALSGGLSCMVASLTRGKKGYEQAQVALEAVADRAQGLKDAFLLDVDRDTDAFNQLMAAARLPKKTDEQVAAREEAMQAATRLAIDVPLSVLKRSLEVLEVADAVADSGNVNSLSDAGVAASAARTAAEGAYQNVLINLPGLTNAAERRKILDQAQAVLSAALAQSQRIWKGISDKLANNLEN
ncbi:MAG: glutamate formimidoyltransferase [Candidatus Eisenbacteria bacterium]|uniref:Formimidoyltransferase-cyclodeaminase n=1 Tax=Eiseniibacteriota bacterium TaxID=2212470 RepID=A0A948RT20_UNCEI|nr:glutamate formimidoyltransferase [Candidatus Eisenbacteria bacterium]MBU1951022.1 glutamate formimidoyltransferase [Candidatus Eisenbacteria bacterium]MBU2690051.1 glutamate formimidoyltransferase [Candidatus Eisenbacteria bacterium]